MHVPHHRRNNRRQRHDAKNGRAAWDEAGVGSADHPGSPTALRDTHGDIAGARLQQALRHGKLSDSFHDVEAGFRHWVDCHLPRIPVWVVEEQVYRPGQQIIISAPHLTRIITELHVAIWNLKGNGGHELALVREEVSEVYVNILKVAGDRVAVEAVMLQ